MTENIHEIEPQTADPTPSDELLRLLHRHHGDRKHPDIAPEFRGTKTARIKTLVVYPTKVIAAPASAPAPELPPPPPPQPPVLTVALSPIGTIRKAACVHFTVTDSEMKSVRRNDRIVRARHVAMYLAKDMTSLSYPAIGRGFGWRDHTTVLWAVRKMECEIIRDPTMAADVEAVRQLAIAADPMLAGGGD